MKLNKLIRVSKQHAEAMYQIALEKYRRERDRFVKRGENGKQGKRSI